MFFLGVDTSNYACSMAIYDSENGTIAANERIDLPVKKGELGLRQSDAVFAHTKLLPEIVSRPSIAQRLNRCAGVAVSASPTAEEGSYMPCFLAGVSLATAVAAVIGAPLYKADHQAGHILAAVYSCKDDSLYSRNFYAVHLSGGTTDLLSCSTIERLPAVSRISCSGDLHAGQCVDRVGRMLGLDFPAGIMLSSLASQCNNPVKPRSKILCGGDCSLSGLQNQCEDLYKKGADSATVARYCLESIAETVKNLVNQNCSADMPVLMSGGVSSSIIIKDYLLNADKRFVFARPEFCRDYAAGIAIIASRLKGV